MNHNDTAELCVSLNGVTALATDAAVLMTAIWVIARVLCVAHAWYVETTAKKNASSEERCCICYESVDRGTAVSQGIMTCGHENHFHGACLQRWLGEGHNSCPLCRVSFCD